MKKLFLIAALLLGGFSGNAYALSAGGDGTKYAALQETAVFFNNSGATLSAGQVVILDLSGSGVTADTTLGSYVTLVSGADSILAIGVVKSTESLNQTPVVVVTEGPVDTYCVDSADAVSSGAAVGTASDAQSMTGRCGGGTNLGIALEAGSGGNFDKLFVWVSPTGAD